MFKKNNERFHFSPLKSKWRPANDPEPMAISHLSLNEYLQLTNKQYCENTLVGRFNYVCMQHCISTTILLSNGIGWIMRLKIIFFLNGKLHEFRK